MNIDEHRKRIRQHMRAFAKGGGTVERVRMGESGDSRHSKDMVAKRRRRPKVR